MYKLQTSIEKLILEFEAGINDRIEHRQIMIDELKKIKAKS